MPGEKYSTAQRVAFAGLVIGFIMCAAGAVVPYWQSGSLSINKVMEIIGDNIPFIGDIKLVKMYGGLWWYCFDSPLLTDKECRAYDFDDSRGADWVIRIGCAVNVVLTLLCALVALCRSCCCGGGKTICHGIMAFLGGAAGLVVVGVWASSAEDGYGMKLKLVDYDWGFYVYAVGASIVTLVSFMLCFASPNNPLTPMIINTLGGGQIMVTNTQYTRMHDNVPMDPPMQPAGSVQGGFPQSGYPQPGYPQAGYPQATY